MSVEGTRNFNYNDLSALGSLKREARTGQDPATIREAARQFESLFTRMMLHSMRQASQGDSLFDSEQSGFYRDMFDDQLAVDMSRGKGIGLAEMLVEQLTRSGLVAPAEQAPTTDAPTASARRPAADSARSGATDQERQSFLQRFLPQASAAAERLGVTPTSLLAHAALETGWGRSMPADADGRPSFNLFGIKASGGWQGRSATAATTEFESGVAQRVDQPFRAYDSPEASIRDYVELISANPRYRAAIGTGDDTAAFANALQRGGYATDPDYAAKLAAVAASVEDLLGSSSLKSGNNLPLTVSQVVG